MLEPCIAAKEASTNCDDDDIRVLGSIDSRVHLIGRMLGNIAIDGVVGAVPLLGDAFDLVWKSNRRNLYLLRRHIEAERSRR